MNQKDICDVTKKQFFCHGHQLGTQQPLHYFFVMTTKTTIITTRKITTMTTRKKRQHYYTPQKQKMAITEYHNDMFMQLFLRCIFQGQCDLWTCTDLPQRLLDCHAPVPFRNWLWGYLPPYIGRNQYPAWTYSVNLYFVPFCFHAPVDILIGFADSFPLFLLKLIKNTQQANTRFHWDYQMGFWLAWWFPFYQQSEHSYYWQFYKNGLPVPHCRVHGWPLTSALK